MGKQPLSNSQHEKAFELLPWKVNGSLAKDEMAWVDDHIQQCPICSQETEFLAKMFTVDNKADTEDHTGRIDSGLTRVMERIDQYEKLEEQPRTSTKPEIKGFKYYLDYIVTPGKSLPYWAGALTASLLLAFVGFQFWPQNLSQLSQSPIYETLSNSNNAAPLQLSIQLKDEITELRTRTLLNSTGAEYKLYKINNQQYIVELVDNSDINALNNLLKTLQSNQYIDNISIVLDNNTL